jgi:hypothetical protein
MGYDVSSMGKRENVSAAIEIFAELAGQFARRVLDRVLDLHTIRADVEGVKTRLDQHDADVQDAHEQIKRIRREKKTDE